MCRRILSGIAATALSLPFLPALLVTLSLTTVQDAAAQAPALSDRLELVKGPIEAATGPDRSAALALIERVKAMPALAAAHQAYDLKVAFTTNSGGQTAFDGTWQMEQVFDPQQGVYWTAKSSAGYSITEIGVNGKSYVASTLDHIPLRLHEARAALFGPIGSMDGLEHRSLRTSNSTFNGAAVTCMLHSASQPANSPAAQRQSNEWEECINPQSGLLVTHSTAPGRFYAYDYANAPQLAGHVLPRKITITEGGQTVSTIEVTSLTAIPSADPSLFAVTDAMKEGGRAVVMGTAREMSVTIPGATSEETETQPVVVFGLVTPSGQLVEAHSLEPSDPRSTVAIEAARQMKFPQTARPGEVKSAPEQHFVFIVTNFGAAHQ